MSNGSVAHLEPYTLSDTPEGIDRAAELGYAGVDLNAKTCRATIGWQLGRRRIVIIHSSQWWLHGYEAKPGTKVPRKPIEQLRLDQVRNLRTVEGHRPVMTAEEAVHRCGLHRIVPCIEMKPSRWTKAAVRNAMRFAARIHVPLTWMTIQAYGSTEASKAKWEQSAHDRMRLVFDLGGNSVLLYRRPFHLDEWEDVLVAIKGKAGFGSVLNMRTLLARLRKEAGWKR